MSGDRNEGLLLEPDVYASTQPAGRGQWVRRGASARLIQTALAEGNLLRPAPVRPHRGAADVSRIVLVAALHYDDTWSADDRQTGLSDLAQVLSECEAAVHGQERWFREPADEGELVLLPFDMDAASFVERFPPTLERVLASRNAKRPSRGHLRLQLVLHRGPVYTHATRSSQEIAFAKSLLDADPLWEYLARYPRRDLSLVMSDPLCQEVNWVDPSVLDRLRFTQVEIEVAGQLGIAFRYEPG
jgi:hypothetical protein